MPLGSTSTDWMEIALLGAAALLLAGSMWVSIRHARGARAYGRAWAGWLAVAGLATGALGVAHHCYLLGNWFPLEDNFDTLAWLGLLLGMCVLYVQWTRPIAGLDWFVFPIVILLLMSAVVFGSRWPHRYGESAWAIVHLVTAFGGMLALAMAGAAGAMYLRVHRNLRSKRGPMNTMASLERLEGATQGALALGWPLFTVGVFTGLLRLLNGKQRGDLHTGEFFGPKIAFAFAAWVVFALALHTPINPSFRGRRAAVLSLIGLVLMAGTLVALQFSGVGAD